jgi:hypothetical protein
MRAILLVLSACVIMSGIGPTTSRAQASSDSLWHKAVALAETNDNLVPGSITMRMQEMDKHGRPKDENKYYESQSRLFLGEDGKVDYETIKVIEDGEDITEKELEKERERDKGEDEEGGSHSMRGYDPFDADNQSMVNAVRLDTTEMIDGKTTIVYEFTDQADDDRVMTGRAWLDATGGFPVKVEYTSDPLPKRVKRMITTLDYGYIPPDSVFVRRMVVSATGGFLFIKKHFRMDMTFGEYWRLPEGYGEGE